MACKPRIGLRCHNPYVPGEIWSLFKPAFRELLKLTLPHTKLSVREYYWKGFPPQKEYIRITPKNNTAIDWQRVWDVLAYTTNVFGMEIACLYKEDKGLEILHEDNLFERSYSDYALASTRDWTINELNDFLENYSFEEVKRGIL